MTSGSATPVPGGSQGFGPSHGSTGLVPSTSSTSLQHNILPSSQQPLESTAPQPPVLRAAKAVNQVLQLDESYPDLDSYCKRELSSTLPFHPPLTSNIFRADLWRQ